MKVSVLYVFVFSLFQFGIGQELAVSVYDSETKMPLQHVVISASDSKIIGQTNKRGVAILARSMVTDTVAIRFTHSEYNMGVLSYEHLVAHQEIYMVKKPEELDKVVLYDKKKRHSRIKFEKLKPLKSGVYGFGAVLVGDKIYIEGGDLSVYNEDIPIDQYVDLTSLDISDGGASYNTVAGMISDRLKDEINYKGYNSKMYVYDIYLNTWQTIDLDFRERAYHEMVNYKDNIYILGGKSLSYNGKKEYLDNVIEVYNRKKDTVYLDYTNPHQAVNFIVVPYKETFVCMGGEVKKDKLGIHYTNAVHLFDLINGYWYESEDMPEAENIRGVLIDGKVYTISKIKDRQRSEIRSFDLATKEWKKEGEFLDFLELPAIAVNEDIIYFFENGLMYSFDVHVKELKKYRINLELYGSRMFCYKDRLYIIGGRYTSKGAQKVSNDLYSISLNEFANTVVINTVIFFY
ncbi:hypothetical protein NBRC110019_13050 [Neptunitalea chrysea]|uniref:Kelch motif-containing protein n=1 Tax=Neptunitalea chrysea TaxID=1647581 RepID=A0A9W6EUY0_9FLAO|nr:hypothetical protein [Neptunitalea chrysea]GLB52266.1 hypothetical protein NBRC110019_13050 [Neptunitalea chrysea]